MTALEQYKKTFWGVQAVIGVVTVGVYLRMNHMVSVAALFFGAMQVSAVFGALWASHLKRKMARAW